MTTQKIISPLLDATTRVIDIVLDIDNTEHEVSVIVLTTGNFNVITILILKITTNVMEILKKRSDLDHITTSRLLSFVLKIEEKVLTNGKLIRVIGQAITNFYVKSPQVTSNEPFHFLSYT